MWMYDCVDVGVHVKVCTEMYLCAFNPKYWVKSAVVRWAERHLNGAIHLYIADITWCFGQDRWQMWVCEGLCMCKCSSKPGYMFVYVKTLIAYKQGHCL